MCFCVCVCCVSAVGVCVVQSNRSFGLLLVLVSCEKVIQLCVCLLVCAGICRVVNT